MKQIGGMSDLCTYELGDIAWDDLDQIDDHIVPHPSHDNENESVYREDNFKKLRHEVISVSSNVGGQFSTKYVNQEDEGNIQPQKKKRTKLLERDSCSHLAEGIISDLRESDSSNIDTMDAEFRADATIAGEGSAVNDTSSCLYSLGDMSQTENDLNFWDNDRKDDKSSDLLYYGWPDIENFEDVERMFTSCDSTLGFGSSNEDNLDWMSSTHNIEDPDFSPFKNIPEQNPSTLKNASSSANDSNVRNSYTSDKSGYRGSENGKADHLGNLTFVDGSVVSDRKGQQGVNNSTAYQSIKGNGQKIKFQKKQATRPNLSEGRKKDTHKSRQVNAPDHQKQMNTITPSTFGYWQTPTPYMHLNYMYPSDQKSEINSLASFSPRESSYASNQALSMDSSYSRPFSAPVMSVDEKLEKLRRRQGFYHPSVLKLAHHSQNYTENHSGVESANVKNPAAEDPPNVPETSCKSTGYDEISLEASSFRQLQQVMEQLDIRTKLCIRDSLYRLARSAEQRHRYENMKSGVHCGEAGDAFMADGSDNAFLDLETDTNPIDRSVAHLLFHRPSDLSVMPVHDGLSLKSHTMIHGSITSPPVMAKQLVRQEKAASEAEKIVSIIEDG